VGKGSKRRPISIDYCSEEQFDINWKRTLGDKKKVTKEKERKRIENDD